uniref:PSP domain-containing protein n=1 Tax=Strongyloides papillosus TaxID=174720 RepID=A0A0N5BG76_STREA
MSISKDAIESYINTMNDPSPKELEGNCFFSSEKRFFKTMSSSESKEPSKKFLQQHKNQKSTDGEWEKVSQKFRKSVTVTPSKTSTPVSSALDQNWRDGTKSATSSDGGKKTFGTPDKYRIGKSYPMKSELDDNWRCKSATEGTGTPLKSSLPQKKENKFGLERDTNRRESFNLPEKITENILNDNLGKDNHYDLEVNNDFRLKFDTDPLETYNSNFSDFPNSPPNQWNHLADQGINTNFNSSMNSYGIDMNGFSNGRLPLLQNPLNFPLDSFQNNIGSLDSNGLPKNLNMFNVPLETAEPPLLPPFPPFLPFKNGLTNNAAAMDPFTRLMAQQRLSLEQEMQNYRNFNPLQMMSGPTHPLFSMNNMTQFGPEESFTMNNIYDTVPENSINTRSENQDDLFKGDAIVMVEILPYPKWHHNREKLQWTVLSVEGNQSGPYDASDLSVRFISGDLSPYIRFLIYGGPLKKWARLIDLMKTANERNPFVSAQSPRVHEEFIMVDFYYKGAGQQMNFEHWRDFISSQLEKERLGIMEKASDGRSSNLGIQKLEDEEHYENAGSNIESEFSNDHNENSIGEKQFSEELLYDSKNQSKNIDSSNKCNVITNDETSNWVSTQQKPKKGKKNETVIKGLSSTTSKSSRSTLSNLETAPKTQIQKPPILATQKVWDSPNIMPDDPSINEKSKLTFNIGDVISNNSTKATNKPAWSTVEVKNVAPINFAETVQKKIPQANNAGKGVKEASPKANCSTWNNENDSKIVEEPKEAPKSPVDEKEISSRKELEVWLREKLKVLKKNVDYEVFCSFIIDVEHPSEVEDYFHTYFGDSSAVKKFIKQFLEKRSDIRSRSLKAKLEKDDLSAPAQAVGFTIQTSKKNKKQKNNVPQPAPTVHTPVTPTIAPAPAPVIANNNSHSYSSISSNLHIPCKSVPSKPSLLSSSKNWETPNIVPDDPEIHEKAPLKFNLGDLLGVTSSPNNSNTLSSSAWSSGKSPKITTSTPTIISTVNKSKKTTELPWKTIGKTVKK